MLFKNPLPFLYGVLIPVIFQAATLFAATGEKAAVVTPDYRATQAAIEILKQGGNAVDAAVAAHWVLSVVAPQSSGIGGGGLFLFYDVGTRRILFFDGSVKAPAKASPEMFLDASGKLFQDQSGRNVGGLFVGVPGALKLAEEVHAKYGTHKFSFSKLLDPAIQYAEKGTLVSADLAKEIRKNEKRLELLDPGKGIFFKNGATLEEGEIFYQPELAKTLKLIQNKGTDPFYRGSIAKAVERSVRKSAYQPGRLTEKDLKNYEISERSSLHSSYQGYDLFSAAPPSDGGVTLFSALNVLSHFGIPGLGPTAETYHLLIETQRKAFSNRAGVADPDLFEIPLQGLLSELRARDWADGIRLDQIAKNDGIHEQEIGGKRNFQSTSLIVADPQGNIAIFSATLGNAFGSALRVAGHGFFLNDLLADFALDPASIKDPQSPELISGGQRPRGPEAPVIVFKDGKPVLAANAYGAEDPAAILLNVLVQRIDLGASCAGAVESPRVLFRGKGLHMEPGLYGQEVIRLKLDLLGHEIEKEDLLGIAQMVCFDGGSGRISGESDFRASGEAEAF